MPHVLIQNTGGQLYTEALDWSESQSSEVAKRKVPMRTDGEIVDTGTVVINPRQLNIKIRLSDAEKTTLESIYDANAQVTVASYFDGETKRWAYYGWFVSPNRNYELAGDNLGVSRIWVANLEVLVETFDYT